MTRRPFRDLIDEAVEARRPLDSPELVRLAAAASPGDRDYWRAQMRLDSAVREWRRAGLESAGRTGVKAAEADETKGARRARTGARSTPAVIASAACAVVAAFWFGFGPTLEPASPSGDRVVSVPTEPAVPFPRGEESRLMAVTDGSAARDGFAEASATAERLAYAFEPVGEQVSSVVQLLIDAVPGSDVFSM